MQRRLRLRQTKDFERLRHTGGVKRHPYLMLSYAANDLPHNRYGFITPKYLGNAVTRNRVKRLLREATRLLHPDLKQGHDAILIARPAAVAKPFDDIQRIVYETFQRAGLVAGE